MRTMYASFTAVALVLMPALAAHAQAPIPPDVRQKMSGYVGTWAVEEWVRETPSAPEVAQNGSWEASWYFDAFIEWKGSIESDGETISTVEYEGYDPIIQNYSYWFGSDGSRGEAYDGEWDGTTIRIQLVEYTTGGEVHRGRCTWPYSADFTELRDYFCEKLTDGNWWVFRRGSARKMSG